MAVSQAFFSGVESRDCWYTSVSWSCISRLLIYIYIYIYLCLSILSWILRLLFMRVSMCLRLSSLLVESWCSFTHVSMCLRLSPEAFVFWDRGGIHVVQRKIHAVCRSLQPRSKFWLCVMKWVCVTCNLGVKGRLSNLGLWPVWFPERGHVTMPMLTLDKLHWCFVAAEQWALKNAKTASSNNSSDSWGCDHS